MKSKKEILSREEIKRALTRIAHEILEKNKDLKNLALVGIQTRGIHLAKRLSNIINASEKIAIPLGALDINLYRDDLSMLSAHPVLKETKINFNVENKNIILVDDVLYTGRTIRAALDAIMDLGRPAKIQLAVLIDRGHRELPVQADYTGKKVPTAKNEIVKVHLTETDNKDNVEIRGVKPQSTQS